MKIGVWMVLKSEGGMEEFYIDMCVKSLVPYVSYIYVQNQGCKDRTIEVLSESVGGKIPLHIDDVAERFAKPRFEAMYDEPYYRSLAVERCEEIFGDADWLLKCDADDIYTRHFFEYIFDLESKGKLSGYNGCLVAGDRFITPCYRTGESGGLQPRHVIDGVVYYDPHLQLWRSSLKVRWKKNPALQGGFVHCLLSPQPQPYIWIPGVCNAHFHRSFGPKAWHFWGEGGDVFEMWSPLNIELKAPKWFNHDLNMGMATYVDPSIWPDFIIKKWTKWGEYRIEDEWVEEKCSNCGSLARIPLRCKSFYCLNCYHNTERTAKSDV